MIGGQEADTVQVDLEHNGLERGPFQKRRVGKRPWVRVGGGSTVLLWTAFLVPLGAPAFTRWASLSLQAAAQEEAWVLWKG